MELLEVVADRQEAKVQEAITKKFGFVPTIEYCRALIAFIEALPPHEEVTDVPRG